MSEDLKKSVSSENKVPNVFKDQLTFPFFEFILYKSPADVLATTSPCFDIAIDNKS